MTETQTELNVIQVYPQIFIERGTFAHHHYERKNNVTRKVRIPIYTLVTLKGDEDV